MKKKKGYYSISVVAKMFSVHQQTIRMYEKEGLINPKRSDGNTRLFSEDDVDRLEEIINLTHNLGVNLAGVEMILGLQKKIKKLQSEVNKMFSQFEGQLDQESTALKDQARKRAERLLLLKQEAAKETQQHRIAPPVAKNRNHDHTDLDDQDDKNVYEWHVEYDDKEAK